MGCGWEMRDDPGLAGGGDDAGRAQVSGLALEASGAVCAQA